METTFNEQPVIKGRGGYRPNAGRPKGKKNIVALKKAILDYTSPEELKNLVERAKKLAKTDSKMLQWYLEMCLGKPKVVERETTKNVTNIAYFLDKLEEEKRLNPPYYVGDPPNYGGTTNGFQITGQDVEATTSLHHQGQESEQDSVRSEQTAGTL
jgi:hypothetical protein